MEVARAVVDPNVERRTLGFDRHQLDTAGELGRDIEGVGGSRERDDGALRTLTWTVQFEICNGVDRSACC